MNSLTKILSHSTFTLVGLGLATVPAHALTVTPTSNPITLANGIFGSDINVLDVRYFGAPEAAGTFINGFEAIGIDTGLILTTGSAQGAVGPNSTFLPRNTGVNNNLPGDLNLNTLTPSSTLDATILEIDFFTTGSGEISFDYVFASEEYPASSTSSLSFADVFGFFLDETNIALLPDGTPVSVTNVNGGNPLGTNAVNTEFFINNPLGSPGIEYNGFTTVLTAQATGLVANQNYTLKLAIADVDIATVDSAVFIKAGTFTGGPDPNPNPNPDPDPNPNPNPDPDPDPNPNPNPDPGEPPVTSVPEPTTILGLLAFGAFSAATGLKRRQQKAVARV